MLGEPIHRIHLTNGLLLAAVPLILANAGDAPVHLTLHEGTNIAAAMSPDGHTIALDLLGSIWTMPASGGAARRITDEFMDARQPVWSPDGRRIAFQAYRSSTWNIWTINIDGSELKPLTWGEFDDREPHWSPDGKRLAFSSDRSGNYDVWMLTLATGELAAVTNNSANDYGPAWSPDGSEIAFVSDRPDGPGVYAVNVPAAGVTATGATAAAGAATAAVDGRCGDGEQRSERATGQSRVRRPGRSRMEPGWPNDRIQRDRRRAEQSAGRR